MESFEKFVEVFSQDKEILKGKGISENDFNIMLDYIRMSSNPLK